MSRWPGQIERFRSYLGPEDRGYIQTKEESAVYEDQPKCDFCSQRPVMWSYGCESFEHAPPPPLLRYLPTFNSLDGWAACQRCHELIEADDRRGLADRSARTHPSKGSVPIAVLRQVCRELHDDFRAHRKGEAESIFPSWEGPKDAR